MDINALLKYLAGHVPETTPEEYQQEAEMPRNYLANKINPLLDEYVNPSIPEDLGRMNIPVLSKGEMKDHDREMMKPENMAMSMMPGALKNTSYANEVLGGIIPKVSMKGLDKAKATSIADAFGAMEHNPNNPAVKEAYEALTNETLAQFDKFAKQGLKMEKIKGENPYSTSADLFDDLNKNNRIQYFPTEEGFGNGGGLSDNPMLKPSGRTIEGKEVPVNDVFRIVHDLTGHSANRNGFGPVGEEIAYQTHKATYSPAAQKALATETRGQNSYVNYGPNGEFNRSNPGQTIYADQKIGLMPDEAIQGTNANIELPKDFDYTKLRSLLGGKDE